MRIVSVNLNGIRAAARKGFFSWMTRQRADVICIQETKAQQHQLTDPVFHPRGYHAFFHDAERKGYSGTALYCKHAPDQVIAGMGIESIDSEGRYLEAQFGKLSVVSLYMPSGSSGDIRQNFKIEALKLLESHLLKSHQQGRNLVVCGDWNLAHHECDIRNWRGNINRPGFTDEERNWMTNFLDNHKFVDAFRALPQREHEYTWWSNRGASWDKNVGWRIDYQILSPRLKNTVLKTRIYRDKRFSDHAPLVFDYSFTYPAGYKIR